MKDKKTMHVIIALVLDLAISLLLPPVNGLTPVGVRVIGAAVATVWLWSFVGVDWTSLLSILLFAITGVGSFGSLFTVGATPMLMLVTMSAVTIPLSRTGYIARIINWFVTRKFLKGKPWAFFAFFYAAVYIIGCFLDCGACCLIAMPVARELIDEIGYEHDSKFASCLYMGIIWFAMWGYAATPIAHTVAIVLMGLVSASTGIPMSMFDFMKVGVPSTIILGVLSFLVVRFIVRPDVSKYVNYDPEARGQRVSKQMSKGEKRALTIFLVMVFVILFPDLFKNLWPAGAAFISGLTINGPAVAAIAVMFLVKDENGDRLLDFTKEVKNLPWTGVFLVMGMFVMAPSLSNAATGMPVWINNVLNPLTSNMTSWVPLTLIVTAFCCIFTNFMSCNAIANIAYALIAPIALALAPVVNLNALTIVIAIAANVGIMTPAASVPAAIVLGADAHRGHAFKYGAALIPIGILVCMFITYPLANVVCPM